MEEGAWQGGPHDNVAPLYRRFRGTLGDVATKRAEPRTCPSCAALATTIASARRPGLAPSLHAVIRSTPESCGPHCHVARRSSGHMTMWPSSPAVDRASATRCEVLAVATRRCGPPQSRPSMSTCATRGEVLAAATRRCGPLKPARARVDVDRQRDRGRRSCLAGDVPERVLVERGYDDVGRARSGELMQSTLHRRMDRITSAPALGAKRALPQRGHAHAQLR